MTPNALDSTDALDYAAMWDQYYNQMMISWPHFRYDNLPVGTKLMDDPRRQPFLDTIAEHPEESGPHLVFADWLEEEGDPERAKHHRLRGHLIPILLHPDNDDYRLQYADLLEQTGWDKPRAEFIRVQCEIARLAMDGDHQLPMGVDRERLFQEQDRLYHKCDPGDYGPSLIRKWGGAAGGYGHFLPTMTRPRPEQVVTGGHVTWRRGWIDQLTTSARIWCDEGDTILQEHPVQTVTLTTALPVHLRNDEWDRVTRIFLETTGVGGRRNRFQHGLDQRAFAMTSGNPARMEYFVQDIGMRLLRLAWPRVAKWNVPTPIFQNNELYWGEPRQSGTAYLELGEDVVVGDRLVSDQRGRGVVRPAGSHAWFATAMESGQRGHVIAVTAPRAPGPLIQFAGERVEPCRFVAIDGEGRIRHTTRDYISPIGISAPTHPQRTPDHAEPGDRVVIHPL